MQNQTAQKLIAAGAILFLLGLLTGFAIPGFRNPRMGLSGHLEGAMNGTFLIALGAAWSHVTLSRRLETASLWLLIYGSFANWLFVTLAATLGTSEMTPIAGAGHSGTTAQEWLVTSGLVSVGLAMLIGFVIVVYGVFKKGGSNS